MLDIWRSMIPLLPWLRLCFDWTGSGLQYNKSAWSWIGFGLQKRFKNL